MDKKPQLNAESSAGFDLPKLEEKVLAFWKSRNIFEKSLEQRKTKDRKKTFVFYEGPPYANGKPGIHHVLARVVKDIILRYKSMAGYYVPRRAGWDTHGLPVEIAAEKALGLKSKKDIERIGIEAFNAKAKENVWIYKSEWENLTERIGYWLDLKNAYVTYASEYIESIWWTLKRIWERKLLYKGHKVVHWCTRCGTALSSHEIAQGYKETTDQSVYLKFKLRPDQKIKNLKIGSSAYILSWTTTPWTLPGNVAVAVGKNIDYIGLKATSSSAEEIKQGDIFLLANNPEIFKKVFGESLMFGPRGAVVNFFDKGEVCLEKLGLWSGKELVGLEYEPLFEIPPLKNQHSHKIYAADFVTTTDGTGVVHTAVMYGEDDYKLGVRVGLPQYHTVSDEGRFTGDVPELLRGCAVRTKEPKESKETEEKIFGHLRSRGNFLRILPYSHEYPYCWRCDTPIIYYARDSWFIAMTKVRAELLSSNKKINWIPDYIKEGRFGEWLREVKDWNLSRERYWGAPLPIWECEKCLASPDPAKRDAATECIGSLDELSKKAGGSKNNYWIMRHGEAESNVFHLIDSGPRNFHLTKKGGEQVRASLRKFKKTFKKSHQKIDFILSSDVMRAKETAEIASEFLGANVSFDQKLREMRFGSKMEGCTTEELRKHLPSYEERFEKHLDGGETLREVRKRVWEVIEDWESRHTGKNILIVSHGDPILMLWQAAAGLSEKKIIAEMDVVYLDTGEIKKLPAKIVPRNDTGEVDVHRPYADGIKLPCASCGGDMRRVKEVADVWYDSGAMPFASVHFPFTEAKTKNLKLKTENLPSAYPADFISEGMDQTRGWFYTLLAVATACGFKTPYKNVISLGLINDKQGQKMSKSRGNIVDPWEVIQKHGVDAVRWYFYTVNPPGEPKNFDENDIAKAFRKFHLIIWNSLKFFETYRTDPKLKTENLKLKEKNVLDEWILARLNGTISEATSNLEKYNIREAALALESFVDDLSRWYIRRSRRRFQKPVDKKDHLAASATLEAVLRELSKLIAPFTPFFAEIMHEHLGGKESVHLENWPKVASKVSAKGGSASGGKSQKSKVLLEQMAEVRRLAAQGLAARAAAGIKVRQPLARLSVRSHESSVMSQELVSILADEVNVKEVIFNSAIKNELELDTAITPELREEGILREMARLVQDLRQETKLEPKNKISLSMELPEEIKSAIVKNEKSFMENVGAKMVEYKKSSKFDAEIYSKIEGAAVWLGIGKI